MPQSLFGRPLSGRGLAGRSLFGRQGVDFIPSGGRPASPASGAGGSPIGLLLALTYASGGAPSTAGEPIGLLFLLTKAS